MKKLLFALGLLLVAPLPAIPSDPGLEDRDWLMEVLLYSYYWYLDDAFFAATAEAPELEIWVRATEPHARDAGDASGFGEIWIPAAKVLLAVKKSDYPITELGLHVRSAGYRVQRGSFEPEPPAPRADWRIVTFPREEVFTTLQSARRHLHVPDPATKRLVADVLRRELAKEGVPAAGQRFHLAARTGVSTDVWVYWQDRRVIYQISGDMDLTAGEPAVHAPMHVRQFRLESNVVASLLEPDRSNALISRDRASRVLFMCLVRGEPLSLEP
jgi:hypothetical protein